MDVSSDIRWLQLQSAFSWKRSVDESLLKYLLFSNTPSGPFSTAGSDGPIPLGPPLSFPKSIA
jgi:hypothetical protein